MTRRPVVLLALSFLGMIDTLFLSLTRGTAPPVCHVTEGCGDVLTSAYSEVGGIPLPWIGFVFYTFVFGAAVFELTGGIAALRYLRWPTLTAIAVSALLTGIQAFVLEAWCEYCMTSAALSTLIFLTVWTAPRRPGGVAGTL
jgi:uncharacterized membrane protein